MFGLISRNKKVFLISRSATIGLIEALPRSSTNVKNRHLSAETTASERRKKSGLYTKTGDSGSSSLYNGERRPKDDLVFEVLGHQDELNAAIGIAREHCALNANGLDDMLKEIQSRLFDLGAAVATPVQTSSIRKKAYTEFHPIHTAILEEWIDRIDATLPPIVNFVIPSGGMSSTHLNMARAICRRAERSVYPLIHAESVDAEVGRYLNRLSDFLFAATRAAALREGREELLWIKAVLPPSAASAATTAASVIAAGSFDAAGVQAVISTIGNEESTSSVASGDSSQSVGGMDDEFFDPGCDTSVTAKSAAKPQKTMKMVGRDLSQSSDVFMNIEFFDPSSTDSDITDQPIIAKNSTTRDDRHF